MNPLVDYQSYIQTDQWRSRHSEWLRAVGYRCTLLPWIRIGRGRPYAVHHLHYANLGNERLGRDVLPVSKFAHQVIIHGLLSWGKPAGQQRRYPNLGQQIAHTWMRQRLWFKAVLAIALGVWVASSIF